jgi:hypothetical protein
LDGKIVEPTQGGISGSEIVDAQLNSQAIEGSQDGDGRPLKHLFGPQGLFESIQHAAIGFRTLEDAGRFADDLFDGVPGQ